MSHYTLSTNPIFLNPHFAQFCKGYCTFDTGLSGEEADASLCRIPSCKTLQTFCTALVTVDGNGKKNLQRNELVMGGHSSAALHRPCLGYRLQLSTDWDFKD